MKKILVILIRISLIPIFILSIPWYFTKSYTKWAEGQENAEENHYALVILLRSMLDDYESEKERKCLEEKINMVSDYFYLVLHSGRTPEAKYPKGLKRVSKFFKRNNIDIYSENFNLEYVAKCVREQEI